MRPFQTSSVPTRSKDIDFLRKNRAACQCRAEKELILVDPPPHGGGGKARFTIEIEVDGGANSLMAAGKGPVFGNCDVDGLQEQLEDGLRVMAEPLMARPRIAGRHPGNDQRLEPQREPGMGGLERSHAAVPKPGIGADDAGAWADDGRLPAE